VSHGSWWATALWATQLQEADLTLDDFQRLEGCKRDPNEKRPLSETIHRKFSRPAQDAVETKHVRLQHVQYRRLGIATGSGSVPAGHRIARRVQTN